LRFVKCFKTAKEVKQSPNLKDKLAIINKQGPEAGIS
jgi:hypothetical protein